MPKFVCCLLIVALLFLSSCQLPDTPPTEEKVEPRQVTVEELIINYLANFKFTAEQIELIDNWEYYGGVMSEFEAFGADDTKATVLLDKNSQELKAFYTSLMPGEKFRISEKEALEIAVKAASIADFFEDPTLELKTEIHDGPYSYPYGYQFEWIAVDPNSGALLLRHIRVDVCPETGIVSAFVSHDRGAVKISTEPQIQVDEAREIALGAASEEHEHLSISAHEEVLYVSTHDGEQVLLWEIILLVDVGDDIRYPLHVVIDAINGEVLEIFS